MTTSPLTVEFPPQDPDDDENEDAVPVLREPPPRVVVLDASGYQRDVLTGQIVKKPLGLPKAGGRQKGTKNKASNGIRKFSLMLLTDRIYRRELRKQLKDLTLDPGIHRMLYQYAYGRPPEKVELSGPNGEPIEIKQQIQFYIPKNGR